MRTAGVWAFVLGMLSYLGSANIAVAQPSRASAVHDAALFLPPRFFLITRECKQTSAEIGSSLETAKRGLVYQFDATDYVMSCSKPKNTSSAENCSLTSLQGNFTSSGNNAIEFSFMVIPFANGPLLLQDIPGGNAIYINLKTRDAVSVSRQYIPTDDTFLVYVKTCKARLLDEKEFERAMKSITIKPDSSPAP